jgi:hypothetical protein
VQKPPFGCIHTGCTHVPSPGPWLKALWILQLLPAVETARIVREEQHNEYLNPQSRGGSGHE